MKTCGEVVHEDQAIDEREELEVGSAEDEHEDEQIVSHLFMNRN